MLKILKQKFSGFKAVAGLEVVFQADGTCLYNVVVLKKQKNILIKDVHKAGIVSLDELSRLIPKDVPVALSFSGRGLLIKKAPKENFSVNPISSILPNVNPEDFLISEIHGSDSFIYALIRKDTALSAFNLLVEKGFSIIYAAPSTDCINSIEPYTEEKIVYTGTIKILKNDNGVVDVSNSAELQDTLISIAGEKISPSLYLAFGTAFKLFITASADCSFLPAFNNYDDWKEKQLFMVLSKASAVVIGMLVISNLFLFLFYNSRNSMLASQNGALLKEVRDLEYLKKELVEKENFFNEAGWMDFSKTSLYSDAIAGSVPSSMLLSELIINPLDEEKSRKEKRLIFNMNLIRIKGECKDPVELNPWLNQIKTFYWVKEATSKKYSYDYKKGAGIFEIELQINDED